MEEIKIENKIKRKINYKKILIASGIFLGGAAVATAIAVPVTMTVEQQTYVSIWDIFKESKYWANNYTEAQQIELKKTYSPDTYVKKGSSKYHEWVDALK